MGLAKGVERSPELAHGRQGECPRSLLANPEDRRGGHPFGRPAAAGATRFQAGLRPLREPLAPMARHGGCGGVPDLEAAAAASREESQIAHHPHR